MPPTISPAISRLALACLIASQLVVASTTHAVAGEPAPATYWDVKDIRPGMKGVGKTVMVGTKLEEFHAEVLGVMRDVSPGRDMILCRLSGCNLEHAGIIQGMSGSPIYIDGKLLGAVAYAWEFAKDPIAGVTPFSQMVEFARSSDKRLAARLGDGGDKLAGAAPRFRIPSTYAIDGLTAVEGGDSLQPSWGVLGETAGPNRDTGIAGMRSISMPLTGSGLSPRAMSVLGERLGPLGMAPMAGGGAPEHVARIAQESKLAPGSPLSIAMVTGDFDISGIGTVTHVEGDRVYGFGHPMLGLGECEFPMMTGFIHTVYPRASVSMKMGSPLKTVGILDTDVSTTVAGRLGGEPDMMPLTVKVKVGKYSDTKVYNVKVVREPTLIASLVMAVLTSAVDTEGNLPEELTAKLNAVIELKGENPIVLKDVLSGPRFTGPLGPSAMFNSVASIVSMVSRNQFRPVRIQSINCEVEILPGRSVATLESIRLASDRVEPGQSLRLFATIKPFKGDRETVELDLPLPSDFPEGSHEATLTDMTFALRRKFRNEPHINEPRDFAGLLEVIRLQTDAQRNQLYLHVPLPDRGLAVQGQTMANLPSSARAVLSGGRRTQETPIRADLVTVVDSRYVIEGNQSIRFTVARDSGVTRLASP